MAKNNTRQHLRNCVETTLQEYFEQLDGEDVSDVYQMVMREVEAPMLATVMAHCGQNQSRACKVLGINRGTLRKKLQQYDLA